MSLLYDTNILVYIVKNLDHRRIEKIINPDNQKVFLSVAVIGELRSIALQNGWGAKKLQAIEEIMVEITVIEITENLVNTYTQIDAFSQHRHPLCTDYPFKTPRNMGKNDLWIASTAALLGLKLVTTDADFNHLHQVFLEVQLIKPDLLVR